MKQIQPVSVWYNGEEKQAGKLLVSSVADDLATVATFYYQLLEGDSQDADGNVVSGQSLAAGNVSMSGQDYLDWNGSNNDAYSYVAGKLNLVII